MKKKTVKKLTPKEARDALWKAGELSWKLDVAQKKLYKFLKSEDHKLLLLLANRRQGKSFVSVLIACEACIKNPDTIVKFVAPEQKQIRQIIKPIIRTIFEDAPIGLQLDKDVKYKTQDAVFTFPNGSELQLAGSDNGNYQSLRGGSCHLAVLDESGFMTDLKDIVYSVIMPTTLTTNGKILMTSTPPEQGDHDFVEVFMQEAEKRESLLISTVDDYFAEFEKAGKKPTRITPESIEEMARYYGGRNDPRFRREYLCEVLTSQDSRVVPEFNTQIEKEIVREWERPPYFDRYVSLDIGVVDNTGVIFAYYDYLEDKLIIEDCFLMNGRQMTTQALADKIREKEKDLYYDKFVREVKEAYLRVSDNNLLVIQDLNRLHKINFVPTAKHDKGSAVNDMRMRIADKQIIIHPRCKALIQQMKYASWDKTGKKFKRSDTHGHYDLCFTPGNKVLTKNGYKNIEDIKIGDRVLTHKGRYKKVLAKSETHYSGEIVSIKTSGRPEIKCTPNHPFYAAESYKSREGNFTGQKQVRDLEWVNAENLNLNHMLYIPDIKPTKKKINLTKELAFLYGYYAAEGSLSGNKSQISFAGHKDEINVKDIIYKAVVDTYGHGSGTSQTSLKRHEKGTFKPRCRKVSIYNTKGTNGRSIKIGCKPLWNKLKKLNKSVDKKFPDYIQDLNTEQSLYMMAGYLFGDGHFSKFSIKAGSISKHINEGITLLARNLGFIGNNITHRRKNRFKGLSDTGLTKNDVYEINFNKVTSLKIIESILNEPDLKYIFEDKLIHTIKHVRKKNYLENYKKIQKIEKIKYDGPVYNLQVEDDNTYTVNDVAVHNCDSLLYLIRNVVWGKNPYPKNYDLTKRKKAGENLFVSPNYASIMDENKFRDAIANIFMPKSSFRNRKKN